MLYICIAIYACYICFELVLNYLEFNFIKQKMNLQAVILEQNEFKNSALSTLARLKFKCFSLVYSFFILCFWLFFGFKFLNIFYAGTSQITLFAWFLVISFILGLPLDIYEKFVLNKKLGFSTITARIFILDNLKTLALTLIFAIPFAMLFALCFTLFNLWWLWAFIICFCIILLINLIYPTIIAPIFNKMTPLDDKELNMAISSLLEKSGFKSSGIFVIDASKRDNRLNAYFGGLGGTKRVVLFDTLLKKLTHNEILAVLAHELGHFKHKDLIKNIIFMAVMLFIFFAILGNLNSQIYEILGLGDTPVALLLFFILFSPILSIFFMPLASYFSRKYEFGADKYGAQNSTKENMISALKKLGSENKAFPLSHPLYSFIYHSHPTLFERINALEKT